MHGWVGRGRGGGGGEGGGWVGMEATLEWRLKFSSWLKQEYSKDRKESLNFVQRIRMWTQFKGCELCWVHYT